jgi:hypothetical protein
MELLASGSGTLFMLAGRLAVVHVSVELEHQVSVPGDGVIDATLVLVAAGFFGFEPNLLLLEGNLSRSVATLDAVALQAKRFETGLQDSVVGTRTLGARSGHGEERQHRDDRPE